MYKVAPVSNGFVAISILGLLAVFVYTVYGSLSTSWSFTLALLFVLMFIASMISTMRAPLDSLNR